MLAYLRAIACLSSLSRRNNSTVGKTRMQRHLSILLPLLAIASALDLHIIVLINKVPTSSWELIKEVALERIARDQLLPPDVRFV